MPDSTFSPPEPLPATPTLLDPQESTSGPNPSLASAPDDPPAYTFRHSFWARERARIYAALDRLAPFHPVSRTRLHTFARCGSRAWIQQHNDDPTKFRFVPETCHDRFCKPCSITRSIIIRENLTRRVLPHPHRFLTLTLAASADPLADQITRLLKCFGRLRTRTFWRERIDGGAAFLELTWGKNSARWHPHLHVILEGTFLPHAMIKATWLDITGDSSIVDIRLIRNHANVVNYLAKYATKPFDHAVTQDPARLDECIIALAGRKLIYCFGCWARWKLLEAPGDDHWHYFANVADLVAGNDWSPDFAVIVSMAWKDFATNHGPPDFTARSPP